MALGKGGFSKGGAPRMTDTRVCRYAPRTVAALVQWVPLTVWAETGGWS